MGCFFKEPLDRMDHELNAVVCEKRAMPSSKSCHWNGLSYDKTNTQRLRLDLHVLGQTTGH